MTERKDQSQSRENKDNEPKRPNEQGKVPTREKKSEDTVSFDRPVPPDKKEGK